MSKNCSRPPPPTISLPHPLTTSSTTQKFSRKIATADFYIRTHHMAASSAFFRPTPTSTLTVSRPCSTAFSPLSSLKVPSNSPNHPFKTFKSEPARPHISPLFCATNSTSTPSSTTFHGLCYVVGDNIDTDQIIPAEYLTLVPSNPEEYKKLGSYAMCGLPSTYETRFVDLDEFTSKYTIIIAGDNFGCGSSREHAPVALGAAGTVAVVAESYARIFFRNSVATGEVYPFDSEGRLCEECKTGDVVTIELGQNKLINHTSGKEYTLKPIGDAGPVIEAGGIFAYARKAGMIPTRVD